MPSPAPSTRATSVPASTTAAMATPATVPTTVPEEGAPTPSAPRADAPTDDTAALVASDDEADDPDALDNFVKSWKYEPHPLAEEAYAAAAKHFLDFVESYATEGVNLDATFAQFWLQFAGFAGGRTRLEFFQGYLRASREAWLAFAEDQLNNAQFAIEQANEEQTEWRRRHRLPKTDPDYVNDKKFVAAMDACSARLDSAKKVEKGLDAKRRVLRTLVEQVKKAISDGVEVCESTLLKLAPPVGCGIPRIQEWDEEAPADASDDESIVEVSAPRAKSKTAPEPSQDDEDEIDAITAPTAPIPSTPSISTKRHRSSGSKVDPSPTGPAAKRPKFANFVKAAAITSALGFLRESPPLKVFERACVIFDGRCERCEKVPKRECGRHHQLRCKQCQTDNQSCRYGCSMNVFGEIRIPRLSKPGAQFNGVSIELCPNLSAEDEDTVVQLIHKFQKSPRLILAFDQGLIDARLEALGLPTGANPTPYMVDDHIAKASDDKTVVAAIPSSVLTAVGKDAPPVASGSRRSRSRRRASAMPRVPSTAPSSSAADTELASVVRASEIEFVRSQANTLTVQLWTVANELAKARKQEESLSGLPFGEYPGATTAVTFAQLAAGRRPVSGVDQLLKLSDDE